MNPIHPDFLKHLKHKDQNLIDVYVDLRKFILKLYPNSNELLYHTHALTSLYSVSEKMNNGFCMIVIYTNHINLAFNKGTVISDPDKILQGTGKWMRHIPIRSESDYNNTAVIELIKSARNLALEDTTAKSLEQGLIISKIKN